MYKQYKFVISCLTVVFVPVAEEANSIIDSIFITLSTLDYIALVPFDSQVTVGEVQDIQFRHATAEGKEGAKEGLDNQVTSLETAFKETFGGLRKLTPGTHDQVWDNRSAC